MNFALILFLLLLATGLIWLGDHFGSRKSVRLMQKIHGGLSMAPASFRSS